MESQHTRDLRRAERLLRDLMASGEAKRQLAAARRQPGECRFPEWPCTCEQENNTE